MNLFLLAACIQNELTPTHPEPSVDTGTAVIDTGGVPPDTGNGPPPDDSGPPDTSGGDTAATDTGVTDTDSPCHTFTFTWYPPIGGDMVMAGEFQTADGTVSVPWNEDWADASGGYISNTWTEMCSQFNFRGSVSLDIDGSGPSSWTCVNQEDGSDAIIGTVEFFLDGAPLDVVIYPDPESPGCGVFTEARW